MRRGSVFQRHSSKCPRAADGGYESHKCRGPWAYYVLAGRGPGGRRRQITRSGFATKRQAELALKDILGRESAEVAEIHRLTTGQYLEQWLVGKRSLRPTTVQSYASHIRLYLGPHLGHILLADLRPHHLDPMYAELLCDDRDRTRKAATVRRIHATLRAALNTAVKRRLIPWNPALHIELPTSERVQTHVWTPEQLGTFLDHHLDHRLYALFHLVALTGMRRGEALGLRWSDVDLDKGMVRVVQQLLDTKGGPTFGPPKTRSGVRIVPIDEGTVQILRRHRRQQSVERLSAGQAWVNSGLCFTDPAGAPLRPDYVSKLFARMIRQANVPSIRLHDLRHTSASLALAAGIAMKVVSDRLGHSSMSITADLYTHVVPAVAREAADLLAASITRHRRTARGPMSSENLASAPVQHSRSTSPDG